MSPTYPPNFISIVEHFLLILSQKSKNIKNRRNTPFWPLYIFTFQKWKGQFWKKSFFGEMGKWPFQILKMKIFRSEKTNPPLFYPITRDIKISWKSCIYRKVEILYIIGGLWEESTGGRDYRPVRVYIEQRRSYDARRKRKSVENSTGNSGKTEFSGVKGSIFILFSSFCASQKWVETLTASISAPLQDRNFKFCRHIPYPTH